MEYTTSIVGHHQVQSYLQKQLKNGTVQHANLIIGPTHVGKRTLIINFVFDLICPRTLTGDIDHASQAYQLLSRNAHPNVTWIQPEEEGKAITLEQMRFPLSQLAWSRPMAGPRVVIIDQAHTMTQSAGNALLKKLEEPGPDIYFFLLTDQLDSILPTIRSRCALTVLYPVAEPDLQSAYDLTSDDIRIVQGLPGRAKLWSTAKERTQLQNDIQQWIAVFSTTSFARRQTLADAWVPKKLTRTYLAHQLDYIEYIIRDVLLLQLGVAELMTYSFAESELQKLQAAHTIQNSLTSLTVIQTLRAYIQQPVQPKPILDQLYLQIYS